MTIDEGELWIHCDIYMDPIIIFIVQWLLAVPLEGEAEASKIRASSWDTFTRHFKPTVL